MTSSDLIRKGISVSLETYAELSGRRAAKMATLAKAGRPRDVTFDEVIQDALGGKSG